MPTKKSTEPKGRIRERELVATHMFDAPRELVWRAYTDPKRIPEWWGPRSLTTTVDKMDVRPGGVWRFVQRDAEGHEYAFNGVYREVVPRERIVQTFEFEGMPGHILVETAIFEERDGKTKLTQKSLFQTVEDLEAMLKSGMEEGAAETMERFAELVAGMRGMRGGRKAPREEGRELIITQVFDAPRARVWEAWTQPERMKRWWGPKGFTTPFCTIDFRVGGSLLYCMRSPEGKDFWATGVYREIVPRERIVYTDSFADEKGNVVPATYYGMSSDIPLEMLVTVTFEGEGDKTKLTLRHAGIPSGADREGATQGWSESFDKLAEVLRK